MNAGLSFLLLPDFEQRLPTACSTRSLGMWPRIRSGLMAQTRSPMSPEENKQLIQRLFKEVMNNNRTELLDEMFVPGSMIAASFKDSVSLVRTAFPDARITIDHLLAEDDQVVAVFTVAGENTGPFMGRPPTGQSVLFTGIHYYQIRNRRITTARYEHDLLGLMEQLGMIPSGSRPDI